MSKTGFVNSKVAFSLQGLANESVELGASNAYGALESAISEAQALQTSVVQQKNSAAVAESAKAAAQEEAVNSRSWTHTTSDRSKQNTRTV